MASEQAASIVDAETVVIPTKSIPQGITALFSMMKLHLLMKIKSYGNSFRNSTIWFSNFRCERH